VKALHHKSRENIPQPLEIFILCILHGFSAKTGAQKLTLAAFSLTQQT